MKFFHEQRKYKRRFPMVCGEYTLDEFPAHWHIEIEILMVLSGSVIVGFNFESYILNAGDLFLIPGKNIHSFHKEENTRALHMIFPPNILLDESEGFRAPLLIRNSETNNLFIKIHQIIKDELKSCDKAYKDIIKGYLTVLSAWFARNSAESVIIKISPREIPNIDKARLIFEYLENNYTKK